MSNPTKLTPVQIRGVPKFLSVFERSKRVSDTTNTPSDPFDGYTSALPVKYGWHTESTNPLTMCPPQNIRTTKNPENYNYYATPYYARPINGVHSIERPVTDQDIYGSPTEILDTQNADAWDGGNFISHLIEQTFGRRPKILGRKKNMGKRKKNNESNFDLEDLMDIMGRRSLRRAFYRNLDSMTSLALGIAADTFHEFAENNLYSTLTIYGHYDTFISKSSVKVLLRYLYPKYGKHILMDVDGNFSMCSVSIEKIKKSVLGFPELVNKTIRPGIYWVKLSNIGKGTYMFVLKNKMYNEGDISENGIRTEAKNFKTTIIFVGERQVGWKRRVQKEIDTFCSNLVTTSSSSDKIRVQSMGGGDNSQNDIAIRPMTNLLFPEKEGLLQQIQSFLDSDKIYKENGIPYRKGYLFYGPRGTGKTSFAFSLAEHFHMECVSVDLSYFDSNGGANAFNGSNTIYIIDEIDAQLPKSRVSETHEAITVEQQKIIDRLHKLLKAMDDMGDGCIIIGTTNFPERLDPAIVRSGRFDDRILFDNLDKKFASMMVKNRGLDPDEILKNEKFPINPAYLEQKLIEALLEKNNIARKQLKSADEVIEDEYGIDASELSDNNNEVDENTESGDTTATCAVAYTESINPYDLLDDINVYLEEHCKSTNEGHVRLSIDDFVEIAGEMIEDAKESFFDENGVLEMKNDIISAEGATFIFNRAVKLVSDKLADGYITAAETELNTGMTPLELFNLINNKFSGNFRKQITADEFVDTVTSVCTFIERDDIIDDTNILDDEFTIAINHVGLIINALIERYSTLSNPLNKLGNEGNDHYVNPDTAAALDDETDDDEPVSACPENDSKIDVVASDADGERMVEDTDDEY